MPKVDPVKPKVTMNRVLINKENKIKVLRKIVRLRKKANIIENKWMTNQTSNNPTNYSKLFLKRKKIRITTKKRLLSVIQLQTQKR